MISPKAHARSSRTQNGHDSENGVLAPDLVSDWRAGGTKSSNVNKTHRNVVGAEVRRRRRQLRWSQSRLSDYLKIAGLAISRSGLAKVECGVVWVGDFELLYFARVLGVRVQDLFPKIAVQEPLNDALTMILGTNPDALKKKPSGVQRRAPRESGSLSNVGHCSAA